MPLSSFFRTLRTAMRPRCSAISLVRCLVKRWKFQPPKPRLSLRYPELIPMRAIRVNQHGGPENLVVEDIPVPEPKPGQVLVKVAAAGVNFIDIYQRTGLYPV